MSATTKTLSLKSFRPYQDDGTTFLYEHDEALLLLRMGGGKTIMALSAAIELLQAGEVDSVLIVAPKAVALNTWAQEYKLWEHTRDIDIGICWGTPAQRLAVIRKNHDITVITYDLLQWLAKTYRGHNWDLIILDEITKFNNGGKRYKAFKPFLETAKIRWGLTGSLAANKLEHMFYPVRAIDQGKSLGKTIGPFRHEHFWKTDFGWEARAGQAPVVAEKIKHLCFQPDPAVYQSQLPDIITQRHEFDLGPDCAAVYESLVSDFAATYSGVDIDIASAGTLVGKLQQVCSGFFYGNPDQPLATTEIEMCRLALLKELISEADEPVLVWYWFRATGDLLRRQGYVDLVPNLKAWNAGRVPVAVSQPASAGHGINAQAGGSRMVWFEHTYSSEMREQATARLHRQGQKNTVFVHDVVATINGFKTVDHAILHTQDGKRHNAAEVFRTLLK